MGFTWISDDESFGENIQTILIWVCGTRDLQGRNPSSAKTGQTELLCGSLSIVRICDKARGKGTDQFFVRCSKIGVKIRDG